MEWLFVFIVYLFVYRTEVVEGRCSCCITGRAGWRCAQQSVCLHLSLAV